MPANMDSRLSLKWLIVIINVILIGLVLLKIFSISFDTLVEINFISLFALMLI